MNSRLLRLIKFAKVRAVEADQAILCSEPQKSIARLQNRVNCRLEQTFFLTPNAMSVLRQGSVRIERSTEWRTKIKAKEREREVRGNASPPYRNCMHWKSSGYDSSVANILKPRVQSGREPLVEATGGLDNTADENSGFKFDKARQ